MKSVGRLLKCNEDYVQTFLMTGPQRRMMRRDFRAEFAICMDGRLNISALTLQPPAFIHDLRTMGGKLDLTWQGVKHPLVEWHKYCRANGADALFCLTYHYSPAHVEHGCRGFGNNVRDARRYMFELKRQLDMLFREESFFRTIVVGIDTDTDSFILHPEGSPEDSLSLHELQNPQKPELERMIRDYFPEMNSNMRRGFLPLLQGNILHSNQVVESGRPLVAHSEWAIGIGPGFGWLYAPNTAILVGPWESDQVGAIKTAARLLHENIEEGRVVLENGERLVLMASDVYRNDNEHVEKAFAKVVAKGTLEKAFRIIEEFYPDLLDRMDTISVISNRDTKKIDPV